MSALLFIRLEEAGNLDSKKSGSNICHKVVQRNIFKFLLCHAISTQHQSFDTNPKMTLNLLK